MTTLDAAAVLRAVKEALHGHIRAAHSLLAAQALPGDKAVHDARKDLKAARAGLRLLRGTVGRRRYAVVNAGLRDAARPLSRLRDARVLLDAAQALQSALHPPHGDDATLTALIRRLAQRQRDSRADAGAAQALATARAALATLARTVAGWRLEGPRDALWRDLERLYRDSRSALREAHRAPTDGGIHEARKQAKYLALALDTLHDAGMRPPAGARKRAKAIGEHFGDDHDLALIGAELRALPTPPAAADALPREIGERRDRLQADGFRHGRRLHRHKAGAFVRRVHRGHA